MSEKTVQNDDDLFMVDKKKRISFIEKLKQKFKFKKSRKFTDTSTSLLSKSLTNETSITCTYSESISSNFSGCKICLNNFGSTQSISCKYFELNSCKCKFCINCLYEYIKQSIENCNVLPINCPDSNCISKGCLSTNEIRNILTLDTIETDCNNNINIINNDENNSDTMCFIQNDKNENDKKNFSLFNKYVKICENLEIIRDPFKTHCPKPTCQNVCKIPSNDDKETTNIKVTCDKCYLEFCSKCTKTWSPIKHKLINTNELDSPTKNDDLMDTCNCTFIASNEFYQTDNLNTFENIKRCPNCSILIERADGCAQVMCKICKHTFCFYCLTSLENDFLLKHYTQNGPCKGKLGHSRISLFFHRLSVIAVFSGTIVLLVMLSPFLLFALPCIILNRNVRKNCFKRLSTKFSQSN
ncbi:unnamed protein product [Brachionus calyciflorus]|uniref:RBR-type E3 ubiquitin transferase n=1 Tax=Brachionus calyciflorus TaxID=104777 RepID=A0A813MBT4_9BILA|nr:unnamed protein product [Brachionus calyciflorus]